MLIWTQLFDNISLVREDSARVVKLNSTVIFEKISRKNVLIDANYSIRNITELYEKLQNEVLCAIFSHCHSDHIGHAYYHFERYKTKLFFPIQELEYATSTEEHLKASGLSKFHLEDEFKERMFESIGYKDVENANSFDPGKEHFNFNSIVIETIHIPGHSPGHTAFIIRDVEKGDPAVLYVSDIGSHPYYGDLNSDISKYLDSINKLEEIYLNNDYILVPAHGKIYFEKNEDFFNRIRDKIERNEKKVLDALSSTEYKTIIELARERIITPAKRIHPTMLNLHDFWDGGMIYNHLKILIQQGVVEKLDKNDILKDQYKLI